MRLVFFGTPPFALPSLDAARECGEVVAVVTQPPRGVGRGRVITPSPVATRASALGIAVHAPGSIRDETFLELLRSLSPDLAVVVAYGKILPPAVLGVPRLGCVNVHGSLLPELRGAAPMVWAIVRLYHRTGVTLMRMDEGMDTGPILMTLETDIGEEEDALSLSTRLAILGGEILRRGIPALERGELKAVPQDEARATYASLVRKEDGLIRWDAPAREVAARVRGFFPWPGAFTFLGKTRLLVLKASFKEGPLSVPPGTVVSVSPPAIEVAARGGIVRILRLRPEGRREMSASEYLSGHRLAAGDVLGAGNS